jgi:hypothetical protein
MSTAGVTQACRAGIAAAVTAEGVTCRKYDAWDVGSTSIATLGAATWDLRDTMDQEFGIRAITFPLYIYQIVDGSAEKSLEYQDINVQKVVDGLGKDRSLGGIVTNTEIDGLIESTFYRDTAATYVVTQINVTVYPFSNVGS